MRVATYSRISTDEERQPLSLATQEERLDAYISAQEGWRRVHSYVDQQSGKTIDRPRVRTPIGQRRRTGIEPARELSPPHRF